MDKNSRDFTRVIIGQKESQMYLNAALTALGEKGKVTLIASTRNVQTLMGTARTLLSVGHECTGGKVLFREFTSKEKEKYTDLVLEMDFSTKAK